jgi:hypothetical protein
MDVDKDLSPIAKNILYCRDNGLLQDDVGEAIWMNCQANVCDDTVSRMLEARVTKNKYREAFQGAVPFKDPRLVQGNYIVGRGQEGQELKSAIQYLNAHSLTVAGSGAGKTTASYFRILQVVLSVVGMWLFDLRKREFSILKPTLEEIGIVLHVIRGRSLKFNPLQLPLGVSVSDWLPRITDTLVNVLELPQRASKLLQVKLHPLYQKYGKQGESPTLFDLFEHVKGDKESNHQARVAILDSLEPVLLSLGPRVLAYRHGWSATDLAKNKIAFELAGVSETDKNLILNSLVLAEFTSRISRGVSNPKMDLWICVDEAQRLCSSSNHTSPIADLIGLVRGSGVGVDLSVQNASDIAPQVISNTATKILGRCGSMADYATAGRSMGLNPEQIQYAQMNLEPGLFIGQLGEGSWRHPFLFRIRPVNLKRVAESEVSEDIPSLDSRVVYASEFDKGADRVEFGTPIPTSKTDGVFADQREYRFCKAVVDHPMQKSSTYSRLAGISSKHAKQTREFLIENRYIREHVLESGGRGRSSLLLEALSEGIDAVREYESAKQCL